MLLREFLEGDIISFLEGSVGVVQENSFAEEIELQESLQDQNKSLSSNPYAPDTNQDSIASKKVVDPVLSKTPAPESISLNVNIEKKEFIPPKSFQPAAPAIIVPEVNADHAVNQTPNVGSSPQDFVNKSIAPTNNVDDSSSLRRVIREELTDLRSPSIDISRTSPSQLRQVIKDELNSIIRLGGITQLAPDETLRSIIHDELEKTGAIDNRKKYTPQNIHIDESLLDPNVFDDDLKVIEIMEKSPDLRTRREELSVLGKLEDLLVDLKSALQNGPERTAVNIYHKLKKEAVTLHFFLQEKRFLLEELQLISKSLFFSSEAKQGVKKVILKESTGEIMDPLNFQDAQIEKNHRPVYHVGVDKKGNESFVDPKDRSIELHKNPHGDQWRTVKKDKSFLSSSNKISHVQSMKEYKQVNSDKKIFYLLEQERLDSSNTSKKNQLVYHKKLGRRQDFNLFSQESKLPKEEVRTVDQDAKKRFVDLSNSLQKEKTSPWEGKKEKLHNPVHTKNYLRAVRALRQKDKLTAVNLLSDLHDRYPKNVAIRVRLHDALEL